MYTKDDIRQAGQSLSNTLSAIGSQIISNRINNSRAQVLKKYQNPSAILYNEGGQLRNAAEIQAIVGQDLMWLTSNGFEKDAELLKGYVSSIEKSLSTAQSNTQYVNMIKKMTGMEIPTEGMDMTRADLPSMYKSLFGQIDPNVKNEVTEVDAGPFVMMTTTNQKTGKLVDQYRIDKGPGWNYKYQFSTVSGIPGPAQPNRVVQFGWTTDGRPQFVHGITGKVSVGEYVGGERPLTPIETFQKGVLGGEQPTNPSGEGQGQSSKKSKKTWKIPKLTFNSKM